jgi:hypothetical protein
MKSRIDMYDLLVVLHLLAIRTKTKCVGATQEVFGTLFDSELLILAPLVRSPSSLLPFSLPYAQSGERTDAFRKKGES